MSVLATVTGMIYVSALVVFASDEIVRQARVHFQIG